MEGVLFLFIGAVAGAAISYLLLKIRMQKNGIPKAEVEALQKEIMQLRLDTASRLSREEISAHYVSKELYNNILQNLERVESNLETEMQRSREHQAHILRLTGESEQKLAKADLERSYVAKETFDIVYRKLDAAELELVKREEMILTLNSELAELRHREETLNEKLGVFKQEIEELHRRSQEQFKNMAAEVLEDKKKLFVDENKKELKTILEPLKTNLNEFREKIEATRKEDIRDIASLKKEIESLNKLNIQLSDDAKSLATALKSDVKMQGSWGEDRLNMILEVEGLQRYVDFSREETYRDDELDRNRKPDFILKLPNDKAIIIDSKVSLSAYVGYFNAQTAEEKKEYLRQHLKSITDHINTLADKNYQSLAGLTTPDYVFMFMPVESALTLAMNQNPEIFNHALKRKIVLITPTTLVATLKVVKILWQKENQVKNVEEIFRQCGELYNKFVSFVEEMDKIEAALGIAARAHKDAMYHLKDGTKKGNTIFGRFETIKRLEAKTNKRIPEKHLREIELLPDDSDTGVDAAHTAVDNSVKPG